MGYGWSGKDYLRWYLAGVMEMGVGRGKLRGLKSAYYKWVTVLKTWDF